MKEKGKPGEVYYTYAHSHNREPYFASSQSKILMKEVLKKAKEKYRFQIISSSLTQDRLSLVIRITTPGHSLSRIMQYIKSRYAERYNRIYKRTGPFWNGRSKDIIIVQEDLGTYNK
jgi:REP element-mobilizing transposase RayT